jgi:phage host-nuclease inhibitor protein Gam
MGERRKRDTTSLTTRVACPAAAGERHGPRPRSREQGGSANAGHGRVCCWGQADAALAELGQIEKGLEAVEERRRRAMERVEAEAARNGQRLRQRQGRLLAALERFCRAHEEELARTNGHTRRSRQLLFGRLGFRTSHAVVVAAEARALRALARWRAGQEFLRVRTEVDREALRDFLLTQGNATPSVRRRLGRAGIRLERRENWFYELDHQALARWG